jgi:hypothetical protein
MEAPQSYASYGRCCREMEGAPYYWFVPTAAPCVVMFTDGIGIVSQDGRTGLGESVGDAAHALGCATLPRAAICAPASCFVLSETCRALSCGFRTCSRRPKRQRKRVLHLCGERTAYSTAMALPRALIWSCRRKGFFNKPVVALSTLLRPPRLGVTAILEVHRNRLLRPGRDLNQVFHSA